MGSSLWSRKLPALLCVVTRCNNTAAPLFIYLFPKTHFRLDIKRRVAAVCEGAGSTCDVLQWKQVPPLFPAVLASLFVSVVKTTGRLKRRNEGSLGPFLL